MKTWNELFSGDIIETKEGGPIPVNESISEQKLEVIIEAGQIPNNSIVRKTQGTVQYVLQRSMSIYMVASDTIDKATVEAMDQSKVLGKVTSTETHRRLTFNYEGSDRAIIRSTDPDNFYMVTVKADCPLVWVTTKGELLEWLESQAYESEDKG